MGWELAVNEWTGKQCSNYFPVTKYSCIYMHLHSVFNKDRCLVNEKVPTQYLPCQIPDGNPIHPTLHFILSLLHYVYIYDLYYWPKLSCDHNFTMSTSRSAHVPAFLYSFSIKHTNHEPNPNLINNQTRMLSRLKTAFANNDKKTRYHHTRHSKQFASLRTWHNIIKISFSWNISYKLVLESTGWVGIWALKPSKHPKVPASYNLLPWIYHTTSMSYVSEFCGWGEFDVSGQHRCTLCLTQTCKLPANHRPLSDVSLWEVGNAETWIRTLKPSLPKGSTWLLTGLTKKSMNKGLSSCRLYLLCCDIIHWGFQL